ncbi:MAG: cupin domain-containing protein [Bacteroidota bacterium]
MLDTIQKITQLTQFNLDALLHPIDKTTFFKENWEQTPLVVKRATKAFYQPLFSIEMVDKILFYNRPQGRSLRVVQQQQPLLPSTYENPDGSLNLNQLYKAYGSGYTIVINEIQRYHEAIKQLCSNIKEELSHHVVANMYLTPPNQKALLPHYDTHDVLVLQVHGQKEWRIFDTPFETPLLHSHQPVFQENQLTGSQSVVLEAGDFMYMPRGVPHYAFTQEDSSLHLTIGIHPSQWVDLFIETLNVMAMQEVAFRKALPVGFHKAQHFDAAQISLFKEKFDQLLEHFTKNVNPQSALGMLSNKFEQSKQIAGDGHFAQLEKRTSLNLENVVKIRTGLNATVYHQGAVARIAFSGNTIKGPAHILDALNFIANSEGTFLVRELPNMTDKNKIKLVKRLIRGGLLKIV